MPFPSKEVSDGCRARDNSSEIESVGNTGEDLVPESTLQVETWRHRWRWHCEASSKAQIGLTAIANGQLLASTASQSHDVANSSAADTTAAVAVDAVLISNLLQSLQCFTLTKMPHNSSTLLYI